MSSRPRTVAMGCATLSPGRGGIAGVARMSARALQQASWTTRLNTFIDNEGYLVGASKSRPAHGRRPEMAIAMAWSAIGSDRFLYDSVGMARVHPPLADLGKGYSVWMHGVEVWEKLRPEHHRVLQRANRVFVNSRYTLDRFERLHGTLPQAVVCPLATEDDFPPEKFDDKRRRGPPTVLILSRMDAAENYKGHAELIECWRAVRDAVPEARLVVAGDGSGRAALEARVVELGLTSSVEFVGFVGNEAMPALWRQADLFAMPSRGEGFGIVYAEAMRHGIPVIASIHDAGSEVNRHGETGLNVDLDDADALPKAISGILGDAALTGQMGKAGRALWERDFRFEKFAKRFVTLFEAAPEARSFR